MYTLRNTCTAYTLQNTRERVFPFSRLRVSIVAKFQYFGDEKASSKSLLIFFHLSKSLIVSAIKPKEPLMFQTLIHSPSSSFTRNQSQVNNTFSISKSLIFDKFTCSVIQLGFETLSFIR